MTVQLIDCTLEWPNYSDRFKELLDDHERYKAMKNELPEDPEAVIISGSTSGIYEDERWINQLIENTARYIRNDVPVLGLCFGHQVIAKALGGEVKAMKDYEIGYKPVKLDEAEISEGLAPVEYPFSTHGDKITELPPELESIGRSDRCNQAFKHRKKKVYGVQFHPELTPEIAEKAVRTKDIRPDRKEKLLQEINQPNYYRAKRTLRILENFKEVAK